MQVASIDIRRALAEASVSGLPVLLFGADWEPTTGGRRQGAGRSHRKKNLIQY